MNSNKKGFTLVELLAVIVILAIIIIIAVSAVIPIMNRIKKRALLNEARTYMKAAEQEIVGDSFGEDVPATSCIEVRELNKQSVKKNNKKYMGTVITQYTDSGFVQTISLTDGKYYVYGSGKLSNSNLSSTKQAEFKTYCSGPVTYNDTDTDSYLSVGDKITLGEDNFYFITHDSNNDLVFVAEYPLDENGRQVQSPASTSFSSASYWTDSSDFSPLGTKIHSSSYNYVYRTTNNRDSSSGDTNNNFKTRINLYKEYLNSLDILPVKDVRLMSYEEAQDIGCTNQNSSCPSFIPFNNIFLGSAYDNGKLWAIVSRKLTYYAYNRGLFKALPVIVISQDMVNKGKSEDIIDDSNEYMLAAKREVEKNSQIPSYSCISILDLNKKLGKTSKNRGTVVTEYSNGVYTQTISLTNKAFYVYGSGEINASNVSNTQQDDYLAYCPDSLGYYDIDKNSKISYGDVFTMGEEQFYFLKRDKNNDLVLLPKYNLYYYGYDSSIGNVTKQSESVVGWNSKCTQSGDDFTYFSSPFGSDNDYWVGSSDYEPFGDSNYLYVYWDKQGKVRNNNQRIRSEQYKGYLNLLGIADVKDVRAISYEEARETICKYGSESSPMCIHPSIDLYSGSTPLSFNQLFWTGSVGTGSNYHDAFVVDFKNNRFRKDSASNNCYAFSPVVIIGEPEL